MSKTPKQMTNSWRKEIQQYVNEVESSGKSFHSMCTELGIRDNTLSRFLQKKAIPRIPSLEKIINLIRTN